MQQQITDVLALSQQVSGDKMATWSDEKRREFVDLFTSRVRVSQYILARTASIVIAKAADRHFISSKHSNALEIGQYGSSTDISRYYDVVSDSPGYCRNSSLVGGRATSELESIADERAETILSNLPSLKAAVQILSPDIAKAIEKRDQILMQGKDLVDQVHGLSDELDLDDFDQKTTIAEFRKSLKERRTKKRKLMLEIDELGKEGEELNTKINKFLYAGLPGLSDAVVSVVKEYVEQITAFSTMSRRVGEQVQYGDSTAAVTLLSTFEKDEVSVSEDIAVKFGAAMEALKLAGAKGTKKPRALKGK